MNEAQALQIVELLQKQVYYQGVTTAVVLFTCGVATAVLVCFLLYRFIKQFY